MKLNTIELFAGAGGLIDGFEQTNKFRLIAAVEWESPMVRTLISRLKNKYSIEDAEQRVLNFDIQRTEELIHGWSDDKFGYNFGLDSLVSNQSVDMISGGPPCQAYSIAGRIRDKDGMKNDYRNFLFESYIKVVNYYKPKLVVFENVEGILSAIPTGEKITDLIRDSFNQIGYEITNDLKSNALIDMTDYGIPQNRKRIIIVGIRKDNADIDYQEILNHFYRSILNQKKVNSVNTVGDAISDLPAIYPLEEPQGRVSHAITNSINGHFSRFHSLRDQEIFYTLAADIKSGEDKYVHTDKLIELYYKFTGKRTNVHKYHVLRLNKPSNTIPAHLKKDGLRHIHPDPDQKRSITIREAARLQTFDDDFLFEESMGSSFEMIGNSVPPKFSRKLAESIHQLFYELEKVEKVIGT